MVQKKWYILQVISGKEKMAVDNLGILKKTYEEATEEIREAHKDLIGNIRIPEEEVFVIKAGKRKLIKQRILPGYILVELEIPSDMVRAKRLCSDIVLTNGISAFVGMREGFPVPVSDEELGHIFDRMGEVTKAKASISKIAVMLDYEIGETVRVSDGPFKGLMGKVESVDSEKKKVRVKIEIFGMPTPVELDVLQVEKI